MLFWDDRGKDPGRLLGRDNKNSKRLCPSCEVVGAALRAEKRYKNKDKLDG
jgi:hypothetical protein